MSSVAIGIDVGGTKIAGALVELDGTTTRDCVVATPRTGDGADPGAEATAGLVRQLLIEADAAGRSVVAAGIGVPEYVTPDGRIASCEVLAWQPQDLTTIRSMVEVVIESDVRCAARAERAIGGGGRHDSFLFVSIGTGVSHTLSIGDRLLVGHRGEAIALGEFPVGPDEAIRPDAPLTVESQASGRAIEQHLIRARSDGHASPSSADVASRAGRIVAGAIAVTVGLVDPEVVILGGGLGSSTGPYTESLIEEATRLLARRPNAPVILQSRLADRGGVIGAGLTAHDVGR